MSYQGAYLSSDPRAQAQAASIGATIGPDGWWYRNGQRLTHSGVDDEVNRAGSGGQVDHAHFGTGHGTLGEMLEHNPWIQKTAIGLGTGLVTGGIGGLLAGGGAAAGAAKGAIGGAAGGALPDIKPVSEGGPDISQVGNADNNSSGIDWGKIIKDGGGAVGGGGGWADAIKKGVGAIAGGGGGGGGGGKSGLPGLSDIGDFLTGGGGTNLLGLAQGFNAANLQKQSTDYAKGAYNSVNDAYNQNAPLRTAGRAGMLNPQLPDLSAMDAIRTQGNPFARTGGGQS